MVLGITKKMKTATALASVLMLTACAGISERVASVGKPPAMSEISNPYYEPGYKPVSLPMPTREALNTNANALWQPGRQTFFKDQRANKVGDILTVTITISDKANLKNKTERTREGEEGVGLGNLLGYEGYLDKALPGDVDNNNLANVSSSHATTGDGKVERQEDIDLKLAAMITQVLPNGNFVIRGTQEVRVNNELRQLTLDGVIRPEDILNTNSISHEKIAEARISYGGKGSLSDIQRPRYGQELIDVLSPF